jgi:hypothetical protein
MTSAKSMLKRDRGGQWESAIRLLALPLQLALSVDRRVNQPSPPTELRPARLTYVGTADRRLRRVAGGRA